MPGIFELLLFSLIFRRYCKLLNRERPNLFPDPSLVLDEGFGQATDHITDDIEGMSALIGRLAGLRDKFDVTLEHHLL